MKKRYKTYIKLNIVSLFFIAVSLISVSLAWFAYTGLAKVETEIDVKSWYIELSKDGKAVSNDMVISLVDIYPGMQTVHETVKILNKGDSDAQISYSILSASILDNTISSDDIDEDSFKDKLSHDYPFSINVSLSNKYAAAKDGESLVDVSISWPLDSGNNEEDSKWGNDAYLYQQAEKVKKENDSSYNIKPAIKVIINVKAEQYIDGPESIDYNYSPGSLVLYDIMENKVCTEISSTCIRTHVIDVNSKKSDQTIKLLPDLLSDYNMVGFNEYNSAFPNWNVEMIPLSLDDLLKVISTDVKDSYLTGNGISDAILGYINSSERIEEVKEKVIKYNGYFKYSNHMYSYLSTNKCYWLQDEYDVNTGFALTKIDDKYSKIYGALKDNNCMVIPVIIAPKDNL